MNGANQYPPCHNGRPSKIYRSIELGGWQSGTSQDKLLHQLTQAHLCVQNKREQDRTQGGKLAGTGCKETEGQKDRITSDISRQGETNEQAASRQVERRASMQAKGRKPAGEIQWM